MICELCNNNKLHLLSEKELAEHIEQCSFCREHKEWDDLLMQKTSGLKPVHPEENLWAKIEAALQQENISKNERSPYGNVKYWLVAAAILLAVVSSALTIFFQSVGKTENVLSKAALVKVEISEQSYIKAIDELENQADQKLGSLDTDLFLLYKDKLATIDMQIRQCRDAIEKNPGNAHIRRYMQAALQDKKETLSEIINLKTGS